MMSRDRHADLERQVAALYETARETARASRPLRARTFAGMVFSKDRPLQLNALLESYFALARGGPPLTVLYRASSEVFAGAYRELQAAFAGSPVRFIEESDFRADVLAFLETADAERVFFLVDDIVFVNGFDFAALASFDSRFVPSLRLGRSLRTNYTQAAAQPLPPFLDNIVSSEWLCWRWQDGVFDWGYPLSLDGQVFETTEMLVMARVSPFRAPNTLERALQTFLPCFASRFGVAYETPRIVNIPANRVQSEFRNRAGRMSEHQLLAAWRQGMRIDVERYRGLAPESAHMPLDLHLVRRS